VHGGSTATYVYDAFGRRVEKTVGGAATDYYYNLANQVVAEQIPAGWSVGYLYLDGASVAQYENGTTYFVHGDHLGSTHLLTNMTQGIYDNFDYLPFGEQIAGGAGTKHKFTGQERDAESNLDNFEARYMASTVGRFMSPDPGNAGADARNPQSWNMYSYVGNNPLAFTDPTGLGSCDDDNDDPTCDPGTGNGFGYGTFPDPEESGQDPSPPIRSETDHPFPPDPPDPPDPHEGFCETSNSACSQQLRRILDDIKSVFGKRSPSARPTKAQELLSRSGTCAKSYYGLDGSLMGAANGATRAGTLIAATPLPKSALSTLGVRTTTFEGGSAFTNVLSVVARGAGTAASGTNVVRIAGRMAGPIAAASAVIDVAAIGVCTFIDQ